MFYMRAVTNLGNNLATCTQCTMKFVECICKCTIAISRDLQMYVKKFNEIQYKLDISNLSWKPCY